MSVGSVLAAARVAKPRFLSYADDNNDDPDTDSYESQSLDDLAAEISEENDAKLAAKPTMPYESIEGVLGSAYVDTFEGARMIVQKQVNLNTVVSHFYHLGMAQRPSFYRYSLILADPIDGTRLTVHTEDLQNISGDLNAQVNDSVGLKADFTMTEKGNTYTTTCNVAGTKCHGQVQFAFDPNSFGGNMMSMAYMQGVTEKWTFGGQSMFIANKGVLINSFAGVYDDGDNCLAGQYGGGVRSILSFLCLCLICGFEYYRTISRNVLSLVSAETKHTVSPSRHLNGVCGQKVVLHPLGLYIVCASFGFRCQFALGRRPTCIHTSLIQSHIAYMYLSAYQALTTVLSPFPALLLSGR